MVINEVRLRRQLVGVGVVVLVMKLGFWGAVASNSFSPSGFKRERIPLANIEWLVPKPSTIEVQVLPAINDGVRESVHARSVADGVTWGVESVFLENLKHPSDVRHVWSLLPDFQTQVNERCMVGVGDDTAFEALMVKHHGRQWTVYALYPKAAASRSQRQRFFRNVFVYDDDGRRWPLLTDADIERCADARTAMIGREIQRQRLEQHR